MFRPRILCLHGKRQNAAIFEQRLGTEFPKKADLFFLEADFDFYNYKKDEEFVVGLGAAEDHRRTRSQEDEDLDQGQGDDDDLRTKTWVNLKVEQEEEENLYHALTTTSSARSTSTSKKAMYTASDFLPALRKVRRAYATHGPFDIVLGFSQGAVLASVAAEFADVFLSATPSLQPFAFLLCAGFVLDNESLDTHFLQYVEAERKRNCHDPSGGDPTRRSEVLVEQTTRWIYHIVGDRDRLVMPALSKKPFEGKIDRVFWKRKAPEPDEHVASDMEAHQALFTHPGTHIVPTRDILGKWWSQICHPLPGQIQQTSSTWKSSRDHSSCALTVAIQEEYELLAATFCPDNDDEANKRTAGHRVLSRSTTTRCALRVPVCDDFMLELHYPPGFAGDDNYSDHPRPTPRIKMVTTNNFIFQVREGELEAYLADRVYPDLQGDIGDGLALAFGAADWHRMVVEELNAGKTNNKGCTRSACASRGAEKNEDQEQDHSGHKNGVDAVKSAGHKGTMNNWWDEDDDNKDRDDSSKNSKATTDHSTANEVKHKVDLALLQETNFTHLYNINNKDSSTAGGGEHNTTSQGAPGTTLSECGNGRKSRLFAFVLGLVGKPSAGKSTLFNAITGSAKAAVGAHPFTTIEPNISEAWLNFKGEQQQRRCPPTALGRIPFLVKDVAGLVPGAYQGRGKGNAFLNDLVRADVLAHVVDISGSLDECGVVKAVEPSSTTEDISGSSSSTKGSTAKTSTTKSRSATSTIGTTPALSSTTSPSTTSKNLEQILKDVRFIREEICCWILENVRAKWSSVRKHAIHETPAQKKQALERFCTLFTGYHCTPAFVERLLAAMPRLGGFGSSVSEGADSAEQAASRNLFLDQVIDFHKWQKRDFYAFVNAFVYFRFPMLLVCNKIDKIFEEHLPSTLKHLHDVYPEYPIAPVSAKLGQGIESAVSAAVALPRPVVLDLVEGVRGWQEVELASNAGDDVEKKAPPGGSSSSPRNSNAAPPALSSSSQQQEFPPPPRRLYLLPHNSTVFEAYEALKKEQVLQGDFVRSEQGAGLLAKKEQIIGGKSIPFAFVSSSANLGLARLRIQTKKKATH
ncbi:unnamed protein product [Amoebophrya sp. A25]|nr:unnamed protein product [Amoebophrya sp. A25]|eukprot:GSA25T00019509001.1